MGNPLKTDSSEIFSFAIDKIEHISFLLLPHIPSAYFGDIPLLHRTIYLQLYLQDTSARIYLIEVIGRSCGGSGGGICGVYGGRSGGHSCGDTSILNGNGATSGEFITVTTTTGPTKTVLAMVRVSSCNTSVKTAK